MVENCMTMKSNSKRTFEQLTVKFPSYMLNLLLIVLLILCEVYGSPSRTEPLRNFGFLELKEDLYKQCTVQFNQMYALTLGSNCSDYFVVILTSNTSERFDLSSFYYPTFQSQRHQKVCIVNIIVHGRIKYSSNIKFNLPPFKDSVNRIVHPNYVVLLATTKQKTVPRSTLYTTLPRNMLSSIFILIIFGNSGGIKTVHLSCFNCPKPPKMINDLKRKGDVFKLTALIPWTDVSSTKVHLDDYWRTLHLNLNQIGFYNSDRISRKFNKTSTGIRCFNRNDERDSEQNCLYNILLHRNNCTVPDCKNLLKFSFVHFPAVYILEGMVEFAYYFPFGTQFDSVKFIMILSTDDQRKASTFEGLFSTFSLSVWLYLFLAILLVSIALSKFTGTPYSLSSLWVVAILLENDGNLNEQSEWTMGHLLVFWLYGSLLIRNFYTSQMYSHLTTQPEPSDLPKSINEMFLNSSVMILADDNLATKLSQQFKQITGLKIVTSRKALQTHGYFKRIRVMSTASKEFSLQIVKNASLSLPLSCEDFVEKHFEFKENSNRLCPTSKRFAFLYNSISWRGMTSPRFVLPALKVFRTRQIYEPTNYLSFMSQSLIWLTYQKLFFTEQFHQQFGYLVDSGLYSWFKHNYDIMVQTQVLKNINVEGGFQKKMNFYTYATHIVRNEDKISSEQYEDDQTMNSDENDEDSSYLLMKEFKIVMRFHSLLCACCVLFLIFEIVHYYKTGNKYA
ncbi:unnamed protein product [Orchesella dallaii]|uniref:Uncharacterized protein n=1 Tax=Orchesella dallaii TaxID=48710 RepID=A0ABP1PLC9_9HEXA